MPPLVNRSRLINYILLFSTVFLTGAPIEFVMEWSHAGAYATIPLENRMLYQGAAVYLLNRAGRSVAGARLLVVSFVVIIGFSDPPQNIVDGRGLFMSV